MRAILDQPPSGGCVLKLLTYRKDKMKKSQPPSGGCVLKLDGLCVCVEFAHPAAFGRLCVETMNMDQMWGIPDSSRLRAAVC